MLSDVINYHVALREFTQIVGTPFFTRNGYFYVKMTKWNENGSHWATWGTFLIGAPLSRAPDGVKLYIGSRCVRDGQLVT